METRYTYQTLPGQTIVRKRPTGFTWSELLDELQRHGEGIIVDDEFSADVRDDRIRSIVGKSCQSL